MSDYKVRSRDEPIVISDDDDDGFPSPASTSSASRSSQPPRSSPQSASSSSSSGSRLPPPRVNPTTLRQAAPRLHVQRLSVEQLMSMVDELKEAPSSSSSGPSAAASGDVSGSTMKEMAFMPRPEAVTHAGEYQAAENRGLAAVAYALCEFIDNALTALRKMMERNPHMKPEIRILFVEPTSQHAQKQKMYILISDNGCGMDAEALNSFARMADAPKNRGIVRDPKQEADDRFNNYVNCSISQWGVGAKTAGFYLGTSIKVITCPGNDEVYEINLSEAEMAERYNATGNAYETRLKKRPRGNTHESLFQHDGLENEHIRKVLEEERKPECRHFSHFLITTDNPSPFLLGSIRGWWEERGKRGESASAYMAFPLADVYYRMLHGPYGETNGVLNGKAAWLCPRISLRYVSQKEPTRSWEVSDLRDVRNNPQSQFMRQRDGDIFRCEVEFDPPQKEHDLPEGEKAVARIEVMYYPKRWERESHPHLMEAARLEEARLEVKEQERRQEHERRRRVPAREGGMMHPLQSEAVALSLDDPEDCLVLDKVRKLRSGASVGSQFWNGRLIPQQQDTILYFMDISSPPELRDALNRIHYNVFFAYPVLTDRVKLEFRPNIVEWINRPDDESIDRIKTEYTIDNKTGQSKKCSRSAKPRDLFREAVKKWVKLDENYKFDGDDWIEQLSIDEDKVHFTQVRLSDKKWVKQGDLVMINGKGSQPTFIRVLCIRHDIDTTEYLERQMRDLGSQGHVIGYMEPPTLQNPPAPPAKELPNFKHERSIRDLLSAGPIKTRPAVDLKLALSRLRMFPLRQVDKQVSAADLQRHYQKAVQKAAETFPTRLALYVVPLPWHELKNGAEMQLRVWECFPGSSVVALTDRLDEHELPVPVAGEKVTQCTYKTKTADARCSRQRATKVENEESEQKEDRRPVASSSNPRAGQLAHRVRRIPKKGAQPEEREGSDSSGDEAKQSEPEVRKSSTGRVIRPPQNLMADEEQRSIKRRAEEAAGGGQRKRRKGDSPNSSSHLPARDSGEAEQVDVVEEVSELPACRVPRALVEHGEHKGDVCSVQHATALLRGTLDRADRTINGFQEKRFYEVGLHQVEYTLRETVEGYGDREHVAPITINVRVFPGPPNSAQLPAPQPLSLRLGQRSNEAVRLQLEDKWHNAITPSSMRGWKRVELCSVRFWCEEYPQLKVSADQDALLPHEASDRYQIAGLKIEPSEGRADDQLMLDFSGAEQGLPLTCCIELSAPTQSDEEEKTEQRKLVIKQKVRLLPGEPQHLTDTFPPEATLTNHDPFPPFSLQYIDAFGKKAALTDDDDVPLVTVWCDDERMEEWVADKIAAQPMLSNGSFDSAALRLPPFFVKPLVLANMMSSDRQRQAERGIPPDKQLPGEQKFSVHLQVAVGDEVKLHKECRVELLARAGPSFLLLTQREGEPPNVDKQLEVKAKPAEDISLIVHCIDDAGFMLSLESQDDMPESGWRSNLPVAIRKAVRVMVSGLVDLTGGPFQCGLNDLFESGLIPYIRMPSRVEGRRLECEVRVEFDEARLPEGATAEMKENEKETFEDGLHFVRNRLPLTCAFTVNVQQLQPSRWSVTVPQSVGCGAPWKQQVMLFAVDRYGNRVPIPKSVPHPKVMAVAESELAAGDSGEQQPRQASIDAADSAMQVESETQQSDVVRSESRGSVASNDAYQRVIVEHAEPVGVEEGDDEVSFDDEWSHFLCESARVVMQAGPAALTVYDDENVLQPSEEARFTVVPGQPKGVRLWLQDKETGERMRLGNPKPRRPPSSSSDMVVERREGEADERAPGRLVLPVRMKFDQLVLSWLDRGKNVVTPSPHCRTHLTLRIDNGAIFELPDGGGSLQSGQGHTFHVSALPELRKDEQERDVQFFKPFVCIAEEMRNEESADYPHKLLRLRVEVAAENAAQPARTLASIEFGLCMLPFSVGGGMDCAAMYSTALARDRECDLDQYRALLNPRVFRNLKQEDEPDSPFLILAGACAPDLHIKLPQQENCSSLRYTLPPPDPSSLSVEWAFEGQRCQLRYHPAVVEEGKYILRPVVEERKEGEQAAAVAHGEGVAAVGRFGLLDKAGKWSYCVTYTE